MASPRAPAFTPRPRPHASPPPSHLAPTAYQVWALQDLGVLASSRVLNAKEPLRTLVEISQNFPFIAPSLTKAPADKALEEEVEQLQHSAWGPGFSGAFINGRELPIGENDLAGLLQTIRRELHTVDALSFLQLPISTTRKLLQLPAPSTSLRIDAKHSAIFVLNDVSKDKRCAKRPSPRRPDPQALVSKPPQPSPYASAEPHSTPHQVRAVARHGARAAAAQHVGADLFLP